MKKFEMKKFVGYLSILAVILLSSCGDDNDIDNNEDLKVSGYYFEIGFQHIDGTDNAEVIKTSYKYVDANGVSVTKEYEEGTTPSMTMRSDPYTKLPATFEIEVTEELRPGVDLSKESYTVGVGFSFSIKSFAGDPNGDDENWKIIDFKSFSIGSEKAAPAAKLKDVYPKTTTYRYSIDEAGKITKL